MPHPNGLGNPWKQQVFHLIPLRSDAGLEGQVRVDLLPHNGHENGTKRDFRETLRVLHVSAQTPRCGSELAPAQVSHSAQSANDAHPPGSKWTRAESRTAPPTGDACAPLFPV